MRAKIAGQMVIWSNLCFRNLEHLIRRATKILVQALTFSNLLIEGREYS